MARPAVRRIFVLGCSRSGTTLIQGILASHSRLHTFPETGFFLRAFGMRGTLLPWAALGLTLGKERRSLERLLSSQRTASGPLPSLPPRRISLSRSIQDGMEFLDALAAAHGKEAWVEKTPRHVLHARRIRHQVSDAVCLHMVRRGEDVVASIVDRARRYPDRFPRQSHPAYAIRQWNRSLRATLQAVREPGHAVVFYESLVSSLEQTVRALCRILGFDFEPAMLVPADRTGFTDPSEEWKSAVNAPVAPARSKARELFDEDTRSWIASRLDTEALRALEARKSKEAGGIVLSG